MENVDQTAEKVTNSTKEFLESNSLIAKAAFLILVIIVFMILLKLGLMILEFFMSPSGSPHLIDGTIEGTN